MSRIHWTTPRLAVGNLQFIWSWENLQAPCSWMKGSSMHSRHQALWVYVWFWCSITRNNMLFRMIIISGSGIGKMPLRYSKADGVKWATCFLVIIFPNKRTTWSLKAMNNYAYTYPCSWTHNETLSRSVCLSGSIPSTVLILLFAYRSSCILKAIPFKSHISGGGVEISFVFTCIVLSLQLINSGIVLSIYILIFFSTRPPWG